MSFRAFEFLFGHPLREPPPVFLPSRDISHLIPLCDSDYALDPSVEDARKEMYELSPIHRKVTEPELAGIRSSHRTWPRTKLTWVYVYLPEAPEPHKISVQSNFAGLSDSAVTVVEAPRMIELGLSEELRTRMIRHAAEVCGIP